MLDGGLGAEPPRGGRQAGALKRRRGWDQIVADQLADPELVGDRCPETVAAVFGRLGLSESGYGSHEHFPRDVRRLAARDAKKQRPGGTVRSHAIDVISQACR